MAILCVGTADACVKKQSYTIHPTPYTLIVMDTTQALLPDAQVKIGKQVFKTSYDGRIVLQPEQIEGVKSFTVACEGFKEEKVTLDATSTLIVRLTPNAPKKPKKEDIYYSYGTPRVGKTREVMTSLAADGAVYEEEAAFLAVDKAAAVSKTGYGGAAPAVPNNISAGKLTAGEVNDFTKWYFWPNVLDSTHKAFINTWRIEPRQRYTVTVTNQNGYPMVNYPVSLTDGRGNTLFQAVTDNTGKAELWGNLLTDAPKSQVLVPDKTIVVDEPCNPSDAVDVLFVFDATGSMGDELRYLQAEMKDVIARAAAATGGLNIRTGAVVYRDHGDEYITRISRLTEDIKTTQAFIDKQEANGGGDYPEAVPEALMAALNSAGWNESARARIAFLILDAPCHEDSATVALLHEQVLNTAAQGIRIVPVVCSGIGESGEFLLRAIALATNGTSFFLTDDSGIGNTHLKPTTDSLKVEHLNDMLVRTIVEFSYMPACEGEEETITDNPSPVTDDFIPNPFNAEDLEKDPTIPHGEGIHYLLDVSGKMLGTFEGDYQLAISNYHLPIGIYFIKTFYNGRWYTKKIFVH